jgi:hypothetical protein
MAIPRMIPAAALLGLVLAATVPLTVVAQEPSADPWEHPALATVCALDDRFAALPTFDEARRKVAARFDYAPIVAGSWIHLLPTFSGFADPLVLGETPPAWMDLNDISLVEVMLVDDCQESVRDLLAPTDPCGWRHTWLFQVDPDGTVVVLGQAGDDDPATDP